MTVTSIVNATWRVGHVEIDTPHAGPGTVRGVGEVVIAEAPGGDVGGGGLLTYGAIPGDSVSRNIDDVMGDTVEMAGGSTVSWMTVMEAIPLFVEKWRTEDIANGPEKKFIRPKAAPETPLNDFSGLPVTGPDKLPPPVKV